MKKNEMLHVNGGYLGGQPLTSNKDEVEPLLPTGYEEKELTSLKELEQALQDVLETEFSGRAKIDGIMPNANKFSYILTDENGGNTVFEASYALNDSGVLKSIVWETARPFELPKKDTVAPLMAIQFPEACADCVELEKV